jgi:hypothetical protein
LPPAAHRCRSGDIPSGIPEIQRCESACCPHGESRMCNGKVPGNLIPTTAWNTPSPPARWRLPTRRPEYPKGASPPG